MEHIPRVVYISYCLSLKVNNNAGDKPHGSSYKFIKHSRFLCEVSKNTIILSIEARPPESALISSSLGNQLQLKLRRPYLVDCWLHWHPFLPPQLLFTVVSSPLSLRLSFYESIIDVC